MRVAAERHQPENVASWDLSKVNRVSVHVLVQPSEMGHVLPPL